MFEINLQLTEPAMLRQKQTQKHMKNNIIITGLKLKENEKRREKGIANFLMVHIKFESKMTEDKQT